jgi:hypothetical protein
VTVVCVKAGRPRQIKMSDILSAVTTRPLVDLKITFWDRARTP